MRETSVLLTFKLTATVSNLANLVKKPPFPENYLTL